MKNVLFLSSLLSFCVFAEVVPEGFGELFEEKETDIIVTLNESSVVLPGVISLSGAKLIDSKIAHDKLKDYLEQQYLKPEVAESVKSSLFTGVTDSVHCQGRRAECKLTEEGLKTIQYVIVTDQNKLRIFVPEKYLTPIKNKERYISDEQGDNALIMHHSLSVNDNGGDSETELYYQNETVLGLSNGYIQSDFNVSNNDDNQRGSSFYFNEITANYLSENHQVKAGFISESNPRVGNSTNILDAGENISTIELSVGTTNDLVFESKKNQPRVYFSIAQAGRLYVTREDGSIVLERNVTPGQHYVSYDELPVGIETLKFEVRAGESIIYEQIHKIYNNSDSDLKVGDWDYFLSAGTLVDQEIIQDENIESYTEEYQYDVFVDTRVATKVSADLTLGLGVLNTKEDYFSRIALKYQPVNDFSINALYGAFSDASYYWQADARIYDISLSTSKFHDNTDEPQKVSLANYLIGYGSNKEVSASYGFELGEGRGYLSYSKIKNEAVKSIVFSNINEAYSDYNSLSAGYTIGGWYKSTIDFRASIYDSESASGISNDDWSVGASISIPINTTAYASSGIDSYNGDQEYLASAGNSYTLSDNASVSVEVGSSYSPDESGSSNYYGSLSGIYDNEHFVSDGFVFAAREGVSVSGSISGSTIFNDGDVIQTKEEADSYLVVKNKGTVDNTVSLDEEKKDFLSIANLQENGVHSGRLTLDADEKAFPLDEYKEYEVTLDEAASDYHNSGDMTAKASSYPGTLLKLNVDMREVKSYISVFSDIEGNPVDVMECLGHGCVSVEELTEGVFKFRITEGLPFELRTSSQRCLIPAPETFSTNNLGQNFCMPSFEEDGQLRLTKGDSGNYYYYVGEFEDNQMIATYEDSLEDDTLTFIKQTVGERIFLFIESEELLALNQQQAIESLSQYALEETLDRPMFVSR